MSNEWKDRVIRGRRYHGDGGSRARICDRPHRPRSGNPWSPPRWGVHSRRGCLHRRCLTRSRKRPQQKHPKTPVTP